MAKVMTALQTLHARTRILPETTSPLSALRGKSAVVFGPTWYSRSVSALLEKAPWTIHWDEEAREMALIGQGSRQGLKFLPAAGQEGSSSHAQESHTAVAILQLVSLGLLLSIGGVGLLLHGLAMQMGGGRLAVAMRCIAAYALMRFLPTLLQGDRDRYSFVWWFAYFAARWVFVFGAAYFCWLAETVKRSIRRQPYSDWNVSDWAQ